MVYLPVVEEILKTILSEKPRKSFSSTVLGAAIDGIGLEEAAVEQEHGQTSVV